MDVESQYAPSSVHGGAASAASTHPPDDSATLSSSLLPASPSSASQATSNGPLFCCFLPPAKQCCCGIPIHYSLRIVGTFYAVRGLFFVLGGAYGQSQMCAALVGIGLGIGYVYGSLCRKPAWGVIFCVHHMVGFVLIVISSLIWVVCLCFLASVRELTTIPIHVAILFGMAGLSFLLFYLSYIGWSFKVSLQSDVRPREEDEIARQGRECLRENQSRQVAGVAAQEPKTHDACEGARDVALDIPMRHFTPGNSAGAAREVVKRESKSFSVGMAELMKPIKKQERMDTTS